MPNFFMKSLVIKWVLYLLIVSSEFSLMWNTHLKPIADHPRGRASKDHVWLTIKASYSTCIGTKEKMVSLTWR